MQRRAANRLWLLFHQAKDRQRSRSVQVCAVGGAPRADDDLPASHPKVGYVCVFIAWPIGSWQMRAGGAAPSTAATSASVGSFVSSLPRAGGRKNTRRVRCGRRMCGGGGGRLATPVMMSQAEPPILSHPRQGDTFRDQRPAHFGCWLESFFNSDGSGSEAQSVCSVKLSPVEALLGRGRLPGTEYMHPDPCRGPGCAACLWACGIVRGESRRSSWMDRLVYICNCDPYSAAAPLGSSHPCIITSPLLPLCRLPARLAGAKAARGVAIHTSLHIYAAAAASQDVNSTTSSISAVVDRRSRLRCASYHLPNPTGTAGLG